ncbi:ABC transporter permease, partial [Gammaproteobacteria bacterium]|nr:ABC transporter permease [Gammaproteobacteria bacterium]
MTSLPIYLGYKYFRSKKGAFASFTSIMAIAGLALGVAALVIVLSVMNGFERELQTRVLGVVPHLIIKNEESIENYDDSIARLIQAPEVQAASPYIETQGLMSSGNRARGVFLTGILPSIEKEVSILPEYMFAGSLDQLSPKEGIVIGGWLSRYLGVSIGDSVSITTTNLRSSVLGSFPRSLSLKVVGIFELKAELDQSLALIHHDLAANLLNLKPNQTQGIRIKTSDLFKANEIGYTLLEENLPQNQGFY